MNRHSHTVDQLALGVIIVVSIGIGMTLAGVIWHGTPWPVLLPSVFVLSFVVAALNRRP